MPRLGRGPSRKAEEGVDQEEVDGDALYFGSYASTGIHEEMIKDRARTDMYQQAIMSNKDFIKGKAVLDVGCGTGILSIFCARAGARKVYAVDASAIAKQAERIVADNGYADVIQVIHGKVEEVELPEKVDLIVSEWMGYVLLYESMLDSVFFARDRWLNPGGLMLPSSATLYINPISDPELYENSIDFWKDVYGINMTSLIPSAKRTLFTEPAVGLVSVENVLSWPAVVKQIDCTTATKEDVSRVEAAFRMTSMMMSEVHGFVLWFDVKFPLPGAEKQVTNEQVSDTSVRNGRGKGDGMLTLSTAPEREPTHWQQTILYIDEAIRVEQDDSIEGRLQMSRNSKNERFLDMVLDFRIGDIVGSKQYKMM